MAHANDDRAGERRQMVDEIERLSRLVARETGRAALDARVLQAMGKVPRHEFVPPAQRYAAYRNRPLPIGSGQTISQPFIVALMTDLLAVKPGDVVLEIGTGSGYQAAVLAQLCRRLYSIERHADLLREAEARFKTLGIHNITTLKGDGSKGWPQQAPFERILVTAAAENMPDTLADQLAVGGCMVLPLGPQGQDQTLLRVRRTETGFETETLGLTRFVPLVEGAGETPQIRVSRRTP